MVFSKQIVECHYSRVQDIILASQSCQILLVNQHDSLCHITALTSLDHWIAIAHLNTDPVHDTKQQHTTIPVFHPKPAPSRVTARSAAEFAIGQIFQLARQLPHHKSRFEVRNKTLGIIGYGGVGVQVSSMAEALGMRVLFYDSEYVMNYGRANATPSISALLEQSDIVSLHVPAHTRCILSENELFHGMKTGSYLIDTSHSAAVDRHALVVALKQGHLYGAAMDLPKTECPSTLADGLNLLLTQNLRHATQEVEDAVIKDVVTELLLYLDQYKATITKHVSSDIGLEQTIPQPTLAK